MEDLSYFESRTGNLSCTPREVFDFVCDIRNFERFIPKGTVNNWNAEKESCSFTVSMLGTVGVRISEKEEFTKVTFNGDAFKKNDFKLILQILNQDETAKVKVFLNAELNQMMKMIAAKPIAQFLELLINEMEIFKGWNDITK